MTMVQTKNTKKPETLGALYIYIYIYRIFYKRRS